MLLGLTVAGTKSKVRGQDHCTATDSLTIWKGKVRFQYVQFVVFVVIFTYKLKCGQMMQNFTNLYYYSYTDAISLKRGGGNYSLLYNI